MTIRKQTAIACFVGGREHRRAENNASWIRNWTSGTQNFERTPKEKVENMVSFFFGRNMWIQFPRWCSYHTTNLTCHGPHC